MLRRCLESLITQVPPPGWSFEVCVIENDAEPRSREVVESVAGQAAIPVRYYQEARRGIPFARNKTIEVSLANGYGWMALIDDDEAARPGWLTHLVEAAIAHGADVVNGPVHRIFHAPLPDWWKSLKPLAAPTGHVLNEAPTNNTLLSTRLVAKDGLGLRFEEALTFGYEDIDFFARAHKQGARIVWVAEAIVDEEIPETRISPWRLLRRVEMQAASLSFASKLRRGAFKATLRFGPKGARRAVEGVITAIPAGIVWLFNRRAGRRMLFQSAQRSLKGIGNLRGLTTSFKPDYYNTIDGN